MIMLSTVSQISLGSILYLFCWLGCTSIPPLSEAEYRSYLSDTTYYFWDSLSVNHAEEVKLRVLVHLYQYDQSGNREAAIGRLEGELLLETQVQADTFRLVSLDFRCDTLLKGKDLFALGATKAWDEEGATIDVLFMPEHQFEPALPEPKIERSKWSETCLHPLKRFQNRSMTSSHFEIKLKKRETSWMIYSDYYDYDVEMLTNILSGNVETWTDKILRYKVQLIVPVPMNLITDT